MKIFFLIGFFFLSQSSIFAYDCGNTIPNSESILTLKGGWYFQKGDNVNWKEIEFNDTSWVRKNFPDFAKDKKIKTYGYYWLRCHIFFNNNPVVDRNFSIQLGKIRDADEVYFNGNLIGSTGTLNPIQPDFERIRIYSLPDSMVLDGENVIAIRIYSSTQHFGLDGVPLIGHEKKIMEKLLSSEAFMIVSGFVFILMGFFFVLGSVVRTNNLSNLFFSLFSILLGFYTLLRTNFRYELIADFIFSYRLELVILVLLPVIFVNFIKEFLYIKKEKIIDFYYEFIMGFFLLYVLIFGKTTEDWIKIIDINIYLLVIPLVNIVYLLKSKFFEHKKRLKHLFIGLIGLVPCIVLDSLRAIEFISIPQTLHFGFMFFLINISIELSEEMVENYKNYIRQETELMKMERVKTKFLYNISQEFQHYLDNSIHLVKQLIDEKNYKKMAIKDRLLYLESLSGLSKTMINDAIVIDSLENKEFEIFTERFFFKDLFLEVIMIIEMRHRQDRFTEFFSFNGKDIEIQHNRELIFLVLYHIFENVYLYTPLDTKVQLNIEEVNGRLFIKIEDFSNGIPYEEQKDVLNKFVRGSRALASNIHGVGIGLYLVKTICKSIGGQFELSSIPGTGTKIELNLPIYL
jgi:signal transduction histidine kinase